MFPANTCDRLFITEVQNESDDDRTAALINFANSLLIHFRWNHYCHSSLVRITKNNH